MKQDLVSARNFVERQPWLRRTLPGEYLSLALIVHSAFGCVLWAAWSVEVPSGLLMVTTGLWILTRSLGIAKPNIVTTTATIALLAATIVWQQRAYLSIDDAWLFSPTVFAAMLGILLGADLADLLTSRNGTRMLARLGSWNWHRIAIYSFVFAFLIYMVIVPAAISIYESMQPAKTAEVLQDKMTLSEKIRLRTVEAMTGLVFFALGATIGSFLNVVVFRMPRGESVVFRPSRCPSCETPIKGRDNVPILGWLMLNGQCRSCQIPISPRYPIVEMICASIFLLLYFVELISGGANLPVRKPNFYRGVVWIIFYTKWDLVALYFFHCFSLSTLLTWALVDVDRQRIPWWAKFSACGILLALPTTLPDLLPVPWQQRPFGVDENWLSALTTGALGGLCGAVLCGLVLCIARKQSSKQIFSASVIVGVTFGWQAVFGVWAIALGLWALVEWAADRLRLSRPPLTATLLIACMIQLLFWRQLSLGWWPSDQATQGSWIIWSVGIVALCLANRFATEYPETPDTEYLNQTRFASSDAGIP